MKLMWHLEETLVIHSQTGNAMNIANEATEAKAQTNR